MYFETSPNKLRLAFMAGEDPLNVLLGAADGAPSGVHQHPPERRARWSSSASFVLASIGSAIGFGNIWRFPKLCYEVDGTERISMKFQNTHTAPRRGRRLGRGPPATPRHGPRLSGRRPTTCDASDIYAEHWVSRLLCRSLCDA